MIRWKRILAPDVQVFTDTNGMTLQTATGHVKLAHADAVSVASAFVETDQHTVPSADNPNSNTSANASRLADTKILIRIDRLGLVAHRLEILDNPVLTCIPLRSASSPRPDRAMTEQINLAPQAVLRARDCCLSLEMPGAWARIAVHDASVLGLLPLLAAGSTADDCIQGLSGQSPEWIEHVLCAFHWCGIIVGEKQADWAPHDLALHTATRKGYARVTLGKTGHAGVTAPDYPQKPLARFELSHVRQNDLIRRDATFAAVSEHRRSLRQQGDRPITAQELSEFLFRTLHERDGHRPYPSGGACYPLTGYLALHRCTDVPSGLYRYDPREHTLDMVAETNTGLNHLLDEAAANAGTKERPQVLMILSAHFAKTSGTYEDLSYSLILKEAGAVLQTAQLSAAAMGLAACPLGTGNALTFSTLAGIDPMVETSVAELMFGTSAQLHPLGQTDA